MVAFILVQKYIVFINQSKMLVKFDKIIIQMIQKLWIYKNHLYYFNYYIETHANNKSKDIVNNIYPTEDNKSGKMN